MFEIKFESFIWFMESIQFLNACTGIEFVAGKTLSARLLYFQKYKVTIDYKGSDYKGPETPEMFKFTNGTTKEGIKTLIQELKLIKDKKGSILKVTRRDETVLFECKGKYERRVPSSDINILESIEYPDFQPPVNPPIGDFGIKFEDFKNIHTTYKKLSQLSNKAIIIFRKDMIVVSDSQMTKRFGYDVKSNFDQEEIIINHSIDVLLKIFSTSEEIGIEFYDNDIVKYFSENACVDIEVMVR